MWVLTALDVFEDPLTPELRVDLGYLLAMRMIRCMTRIQSEAQEVDNVDSAWFCRSGKDVCSGWRLRRSGVASGGSCEQYGFSLGYFHEIARDGEEIPTHVYATSSMRIYVRFGKPKTRNQVLIILSLVLVTSVLISAVR
jgi:hypothetical protein